MQVIYEQIGSGHSNFRSTDPDIAAAIRKAVGAATSVVNVGAGTGSYEERAPDCLAIEPSTTMIAQRPPGSARVVQGAAECLPLRSDSFDAAMALLTVHHWTDLDAGLSELRRVARRIVLLTFDAVVHDDFWLFAEYLPEAVATSSQRPPTPRDIAGRLGGASVSVVPISPICRDGFVSAYWRRPEAFLDPEVRNCCSGFAHLPEALVEERMVRSANDLDSGRRQAGHPELQDATSFDGGLRLVAAG